MRPRLGLAVLAPLLVTAAAAAQDCQQLSGVYSATLSGVTAGASADAGSCGGGLAPEAFYFYTAPQTGSYTFDTIGSSFDTVLYVREFGGAELGCNDDIAPGVLESRLRLDLTQGESVTIVVDGLASGNFVLRINGNCPLSGRGDPRELPAALSFAVTGTTRCGSFLSGGASCGDGGDNAADSVFLYTAPAGGTYVIDTVGSSYDTLLAIRADGCSGPTLACNDDISPQQQQSRLAVDLAQGEAIVIAVDGFGSAGGDFTLHVQATPFTPTATRTRTPTRTRTVTATATMTFSPSSTRTPTSTRTPSLTRTTTPSRTVTPTPSPTAPPTSTSTSTPSRTSTASRTATVTRTPTVTRSATATATAPASATGTRTPTATATPTPSSTSSPTATPTATRTGTPTPTETYTAPPTRTPTATSSPTGTATPSPTASGTPTSTGTETPTRASTATATSAPVNTRTPTPTSLPTATSTSRPPEAPSDLTCATFFNTLGWFVHLEWNDRSADESEFHIERLESSPPEVWAETATVDADVSVFQDGPFDSGLRIEYRVRAHRHGDDAFSAPSNTAVCTTASPTATPAPPSPTATPVPTVTRTATPTSPGPPSSQCRARRGGGYTCRIDFEIIPGGYAPVPFTDVIRDQYVPEFGVSFPAGGTVLRPPLGTSSPEFALMNATSGGELEFNPGPLRLEMHGVTVDRLALRTGLAQKIAGVRPVLTVFDADGSHSLSVSGAEFAAAGTAIDQLLVLAPPDFAIARAELLFTGDTSSARNAVEVVDDVELGLQGGAPCPPSGDSEAPAVRIDAPDDGATWNSLTLPMLRGTIREASGALGAVSAEVQSFSERLSLDLGPWVERDEFDPGLFHFAMSGVGLFDGDDDVTVRASDRACPPNHGSRSVRLKVETPPPTLNFYALGLEVTQAIQDTLQTRGVAEEGGDPTQFRALPYGGAMPLVANKLLFVRAYPGISGSSDVMHGVPAELRVGRGAVETTLRAAPIDVDPADNQLAGMALDVGRTVDRRRADPAKGWLFAVPLSLTHEGRIERIELHVNPPALGGPVECMGCNDAADVLAVSGLDFRRAARLGIRVVYTRDKSTRLETEADAGPRTLCDSFHKSFPLAEGCGTHPANGIYLTAIKKEYDSSKWIPGVTDTAIELRELACKVGPNGRQSADFYQENLTLSPAASTGVGYGTGYGGSGCSSAAEYDWPTAAQEVAHSWLLCHAPCGNPPNLCPGYPNGNARIDNEGFHTGRFKVMPRSSLDWMSYCDDYDDPPDFNNWTSPYVYRRLAAGLAAGGGGAVQRRERPAAEPIASPHLLASGTIRDGGEIDFAPLYVAPPQAPDAIPEAGLYTLELLGADGHALSRWGFDGEHLSGELGVVTFHLEVPFDEMTARVLLRRGETVLAERDASANPPSVELLAPEDGAAWSADEQAEVRWRAEDDDGDPLYARVQYSADGGATWLGLGEDLTESEIEVNGGDIPGSANGVVRVLVSDGLRTAVASRSITVGFKDPRLWISGAPPDGIVLAGSVLNLHLDYLDFDDQSVAPSEIVWRSDRLGVLGQGADIEIAGRRLPAGANRIVATLPGKQKPTVSAGVLLLRPPLASETQAGCGGDCDGDGGVTVDEIVAAANVRLGVQSPALCPAYGGVPAGQDLVAAVVHALEGCP